jgi:uncharacterized protein
VPGAPAAFARRSLAPRDLEKTACRAGISRYNQGVIARPDLLDRVRRGLARSPVVALVGPRQCGKTTLARDLADTSPANYFDLENPVSLQRLDQPMTALQSLTGLIVIDEVQRRPELFPVLRVLCDRPGQPARFLVLGSASPELLRQASESLAGRIETIPMGGFSLAEVGASAQDRLWLRGGFPRSYLALSEVDSLEWRRNFIQTFLERDIPQFGYAIPALSVYRFWRLLAHYHGQVWNAAEAARVLNVNQSTTRRYLDLLDGLFMVRQLPAWHANLGKRQVKAPKIYFRDTGLLHQLLGVHDDSDLLLHPRVGASWEGLVIEEVIKRVRPDEAYFWATHAGAELDLLLLTDGRRIGVECKRMDAPKATRSMHTAMDDLKLDQLYVVYPGQLAYPLADRMEALPFTSLAQDTATPWGGLPRRA